MFASASKWFALRKQRQHSRDVIKGLGLHLSPKGRCYMCGENTHGIHTIQERVSCAGERFVFLSNSPLGYVCLRCKAVGVYRDTSSKRIHVDDWQPDTFKDDVKR
jgi:hypothetical protein